MDFFEHQERARANTAWLVFYFVLAVLGTIVAVYAVAIAGYVAVEGGSGYNEEFVASDAWRPDILVIVAIACSMIIGVGSASKLSQLSAGGSVVAESLGGRRISTRPRDIHELKLWNVVEEMSIASGVPVPDLYVMDEERGINAFAAGWSPSDAAIGVTRGCIEQLSRDELQGVIAHEFSHILNGDMRLNTRLIGILAGILGLAVIGRILFEFGIRVNVGSRDNKNALPIVVVLGGLAVLAIGYIGLLCGRLIQAAISRQREFLADASAVQFTRNPDGLLGAFKLIALGGSRIQNPEAEETSHMFFANGLSASWAHAFATHPPLDERIRRLDASGRTLAELKEEMGKKQGQSRLTPEYGEATAGFQGGDGLPPVPDTHPGLPPVPGSTRVEHGAAAISESFGQNHLEHARQLRDGFPPELAAAAHEPISAAALVYGLLLDRNDESIRTTQIGAIGELHPAVRAETKRLWPSISRLEVRQRLPMLDIAMPALRDLSRPQYKVFRRRLEELANADGVIDLSEYALFRSVRRHLDIHFGYAQSARIVYKSMAPLLPDALVTLSLVAYISSDDPDEIHKAFKRGSAQLYGFEDPLPLLPAEQCGLEALDQALERLAQSTPLLKKTVLYACASAVMTDNVVSDQESELLRAIADALETPIPPFVGTRV